MSHWAEIDSNNEVIRVLVGANNDPNGDEGYKWLVDNLGGRWIKTSYSGSIRKNYAMVGGSYDEDLDAFLPIKPFDSWVVNQETYQWQAPTPKPDGNYVWNEEETSWVELSPQEV